MNEQEYWKMVQYFKCWDSTARSVISMNPNITWDTIKNNPTFMWDWDSLSKNPNITWDIITKNPEYPWNWYSFCKNPNITLDIVKSYPNVRWDWGALSANSAIKWNDVNNLDLSWDYFHLHQNPNMNIQNLEYMDRKLHEENSIGIIWTVLSSNPSITIHDMRKYKDEAWFWKFLSRNPNITYSIVKENMDLKWNIDGLLGNPNFTVDRVKQLFDIDDINYDMYVGNPNVELDELENIIEEYGFFETMSSNPNITMDFIQKYHYERWKPYLLFKNEFLKNPWKKKIISVKKIQKVWKRYWYIPYRWEKDIVTKKLIGISRFCEDSMLI